VIVLDENIPKNQTALLESWRIHFRQIDVDFGRSGMTDEDIIPLLLRKSEPTLFTRDKGFYNPGLCHRRNCLVVLAVGKDEAASFVRRFLRHKEFKARSKRMGKVIQISRAQIRIRAVSQRRERSIKWLSAV